MSLRDHKMALLRQLGLESHPISLPNLILKLDDSFRERTVRRWLNLLVLEGAVCKIGNKKGTKYYVVKRVEKQDHHIVSSCFGSKSLKVLEEIKKPLFERKPVTYTDHWLNSYHPNHDFYLPLSTREKLLKAGQRVNINDRAGTYAHQIFNRLLIDLSYNSSRLEGNTYSLLDTERLILHGDSPEGKLDAETIMILNHKEAIRYLVDNAPRLEVNYNTVCTLHYLLSDGLVQTTEAGKIRKHGVRIGGSVYMPLEEPNQLQSQLEKITHKASLILDPFEQSIFLLAHVSYLQAFTDVNKRVARLSANISLIKQNLVPLAFSDIQIEDYISAMIAVYELQDIRPLVDLYIYSYLRTCAAYDSTVKAMGIDEIRVKYRQERRTLIREIISEKIIGNPLKKYIQDQTNAQIQLIDRKAFIEDLIEDLEQLDEARLAGLGVTPQQLFLWQKDYKNQRK